jgi:hypothetical protein
MPEWWETALKILAGVTPFVVAVGGILLYISQLRWSKKFLASKDEIIKSKDAEIASLKTQVSSISIAKDDALKAKDTHIAVLDREIKGLQELNPPKLREYAQSVQQQLEEYNDLLKQKIEEKDSAIQELELRGQSHLLAFTQLTQEKESLEVQIIDLKQRVNLTREDLLTILSKTDNETLIYALSFLRRPGHCHEFSNNIYSLLNTTRSWNLTPRGIEISSEEEDKPSEGC